MFDVGALIFKIQAAGAQVFQRDMAQADQAIKKVEGSAKSAKPALDAQGKASDDLGGKSENAGKKQRKQAEATEAQVQAAKTLSLALIASGAAITAVIGLSVAKYTEFDAQMSNVRAATMATADEQRDLADAALEAGADTAYSAREAAAAEEELAKAGMTVSEIVGGSLKGSLSLAAAGQLEVARSAEIMATTLKQYKLPAEQAAHVSDVLAAGAGKAQGSVEDLSLALSYVGPVAAGLGISLEETGGALAYMASQGILGEKAGTGLRGVLMSLTAPSAIATRTMQEYGIEIFDAQGNMKSLSTVSEILRQRLGGLSEAERSAALGRIFGNEQITTARILYAGGAKAIDEWTAAVDDSGYAAEQAAMRQDNLAGDVEKLGGAFDTALIKTGSGANEVLREMVQSVTALVDWYGELPEPVQSTALVVGVLTGAVLLASGAALGLTARFTELRVQLEKSNISMGKTAAIGGAVGLALAGVVTIVALLAQRQAEARAQAEAYADTLEEGTLRVTERTREATVAALQADKAILGLFGSRGSAADGAERLGVSITTMTDAVLGSSDALEELSVYLKAADGDEAALAEVMDRSNLSRLEAVEALDLMVTGLREQGASLEEGIHLEKQKTDATESGIGVTQSAAEAYLEAADGAEDLNSQLQQLIDQVNEANGVGQDAISTNLDYKDALAGVDETIQKARDGAEGYALTLDENTQAGRDNKQMLVDLAENAWDAAAAQLQLDGDTKGFIVRLEESRQKLYDAARAMGATEEEAAALRDGILAIPDQKTIDIIADTARAATAVDDLIRSISQKRAVLLVDQRPGTVVRPGQPMYQADGGHVRFFAGGGEHHVAQFARAGDWRVWAEPETGGEWYLPDAPAKRARSLQIAEQMVDGWGFSLVPKAAAQGRTAPAAPSGPVELAPGSIRALSREIAAIVRTDERRGGVTSG